MAHSNKFQRRSHRKHRIEKMPNGYLEDCTQLIDPTPKSTVTKREESPISIKNNNFRPSSIILTTLVNSELTAETSYQIKFNTGIVEGYGLSVNDSGDQLTFMESGSYYFQICGEAIPYTNVGLTLVYQGNFSDNIKPFSEIAIPREEKTFCSTPTLLPIDTNQTLIVKLVPDAPETILLMAGFRLIIYKVA